MSKVPVSLRMDPTLHARVQRFLFDPVTKRARYGAFVALVESLLWQWTHEQDKLAKQNRKEQPSD